MSPDPSRPQFDLEEILDRAERLLSDGAPRRAMWEVEFVLDRIDAAEPSSSTRDRARSLLRLIAIDLGRDPD